MPKPAKTFDDPVVLEAALEGLQLQKTRIEAQIVEIRGLLGKHARSGSAEEVFPAKKRNLSTEARRRIGAAQKRRWAEYRKANAGSR